MMRTTLSKKIAWGAVIAITVLLLLLLEIIVGTGVSFHDLVISQGEWTGIMTEREETDEDLISSLNFDGQNLTYDRLENRWLYSVVDGSSTAYDPLVRVRGEAAKIAVLSEELSEEMVEKSEVRKLMAYTDDVYRVYDIAVTTLPIVSLDYDGELTLTSEQTGQMKVFDNRSGAKQRVTISDMAVHKRGGVSLKADKPSLKVSLTMESLGGNKRNNFLSLLGMRQDDDWVLYSAVDTINNVFSSNLWDETSAENNSLGVHNGYEYKYVELIVNGEYEGLYALGYRPDEKMMELATDENGEYTEYMFRKSDWGAGYIKNPDEWDETLATDGFSLVSTTKHENEAWKVLGDYYKAITTSRDENELRAMSDLRTATDYHLFINLVQAIDQVDGLYDKNFFLTFKKNNGEYVALYTPWDLDVSLGRGFVEGDVDRETNVELKISPVARLAELGSSLVDMEKRYRDLRMREWSDEAMKERFDRYEEQIYDSGAFVRDAKRWDIEVNKDNKNLDMLKKYTMGRLEYLDDFYNLNEKDEL